MKRGRERAPERVSLSWEPLSAFFEVDNETRRLCLEHFGALERWNRVMNLVGDLDPATAVLRHYAEGLYLANLLEDGVTSVADFGSGAGFPGVCVAASRRDCQVWLIEAREKRAVFLREATRSWGNVSVFAGDGATFPSAVDAFVARAVRPGDVLDAVEGRESVRCVLLLVAASVCGGLEDQYSNRGWVVRTNPLPWRAESAVLSFTR